jgi:hypothetical protein
MAEDIQTQMESLTQEVEKLTRCNLSSSDVASHNDAPRKTLVEAMRKLASQLETPLELSRRLAWQEPAHLISIKMVIDLGISNIFDSSLQLKALLASKPWPMGWTSPKSSWAAFCATLLREIP